MEGTGGEREGKGEEEGKRGGWTVEGGKEEMKGREREGVGTGEGELVPPPPHDLFATRPCQYSSRQKASFQLSNATICPHGSKLVLRPCH